MFITIARWLSAIQISPDSTAYILAAKSFVHHGSFFNSVFTLTDAPSPIKETIYNVYPIGFPSILVLFLWLFKDLVISIAIMQSLIFIFLYCSLNTLLNTIKIPFVFKIPVFLFLLSSRIYQENFTYFLTEPLFISINILMVDQSIKFLQADSNTKKIRALRLFTFLAFLCPLIRFNGIFSFLFIILPLYFSKNRSKEVNKWILLVLSAAIFPTAIYFIRNKILLGTINTFHTQVGSTLNLFNIPFLFSSLYYRLFNSNFIFFTTSIFFTLCILYIYFNFQSVDKKPFITIFSVWIISTLTTWALTLVSSSEPVSDRYLGFSYLILIVFMTLLFFNVYGYFKGNSFKYLTILILPIYFIINHSNFFNIVKNWKPFYLSRPTEMQTWDYIINSDWYFKSNFYVTDYNYRHAVFSNLIQIIIEELPNSSINFSKWNTYLNANSKGLNYFYLFKCDSVANESLKHFLHLRNTKYGFKSLGGHCMYYIKN